MNDLLTLADVARTLPAGPKGRKPSTCAIWRWITKGIDGERLQAVRIGHAWYVRPDALLDFGRRLSDRSLESLDARQASPASAPTPKPRSEARRAREVAAAEASLRAKGVLR